HGMLTLATTNGLTSVSGSGTASVTFAGSLTDLNAALEGLIYTPAGDYNGSDTLGVNADDGGTNDSDTVDITVNASEEPPVNTVPGTQTIDEDTFVTFSTASGNAISVADPDVGAGNLQVTLSGNFGNVTLGSTSGLSGLTGNGTGTVSFQGSLA